MDELRSLQPGLTAEETFVVSADDGADALGSGDVPVLATPRLIAWCERATVRAIDDRLPPGATSVGVRIEFDHVAATPRGGTVTVRAELGVVEGRRLTFSVHAHDDTAWVGSGTIVRTVVERERFLSRVARR